MDDFNDFAALMDGDTPLPPRKEVDIAPAAPSYIEQAAAAAVYTEKCHKCGGTGSFRSYTGRRVGDCFACKGQGTRTFKTSPEARQKSRLAAGKRALAKIESTILCWETWCKEHKAAYDYLVSRQYRWDFAADLLIKGPQYGELTDNQLAAVERAMDRDAERAKKPVGTGLDLSNVPSGMYAVPGGETRLKVSIRQATRGKWKGWTFVDDGGAYGHRQNYGRQAPGGTYTGKIVAELTAIAADPKAAMAAYGHLTSQCGVCGRHLEDEESIARGIGPVCAAKFG